MKIEEYKIIEANNPSSLELSVGKHIDKGWQPYGGLLVLVNPSNYCEDFQYTQAMVRVAGGHDG
jgi:hypothetical protein